MKFGQSIEFKIFIEVNIEMFFLKNHTQNVMEKLVPDPFIKNSNWAHLWIDSQKFHQVSFYRSLLKYIKTKMLTIYFYLIKLFKKTKRGLELICLPHFLHDFWRKIFLTLCFTYWPKSWPDYLSSLRCWPICVLELFVVQFVTS